MFAENLVSVTESENFPAVKKKGREKGEKRELCGREGHFFPVDRISEKGQKWPSPACYSVSNLSQKFAAGSGARRDNKIVSPLVQPAIAVRTECGCAPIGFFLPATPAARFFLFCGWNFLTKRRCQNSGFVPLVPLVSLEVFFLL